MSQTLYSLFGFGYQKHYFLLMRTANQQLFDVHSVAAARLLQVNLEYSDGLYCHVPLLFYQSQFASFLSEWLGSIASSRTYYSSIRSRQSWLPIESHQPQ